MSSLKFNVLGVPRARCTLVLTAGYCLVCTSDETSIFFSGHGEPDHSQCIKISTDASLREMVLPGLLVIFSPIITGAFFGVECVCGLLVGSLTSGVQLAISQANTGGAWDNAKKYVEKGCVKVGNEVQGKGMLLLHFCSWSTRAQFSCCRSSSTARLVAMVF